VEPSLPERSPDPKPVIANPPDIKKEEKDKSGFDSSKKEVITAKNTPVAPPISDDPSKEKAPAVQSKVVATQAAVLINKKTVLYPCLRDLRPTMNP
jgi:hypothetical protein